MNWENILLSEEERKEKQRIENIKKYGLKDMTLLTSEEILGSDTCEQSEIFKNYGTKAAITDFAVVLGGFINDNYIDDVESLINRTGYWWTKSSGHIGVYSVDSAGSTYDDIISNRNTGCRPAIPFSSISKICSNKGKNINDLLEVEYGEYPQWACSKELSIKLEKLYKNNKLNTTGKVYTTDSRNYYECDKDFDSQKYIEYIYNNKKYVRVKVNSCYAILKATLSNEEKYENDDYVWIEVSPVKWLVDEKKDIAITKNIIVAGIQFNKEDNYNGNGLNFDEMNIKKFMDKYLSKEIIPDIITYENDNLGKEETLEEALINLQRKADEIMGEFLYLVKDREKGYQKELKK